MDLRYTAARSRLQPSHCRVVPVNHVPGGVATSDALGWGTPPKKMAGRVDRQFRYVAGSAAPACPTNTAIASAPKTLVLDGTVSP